MKTSPNQPTDPRLALATALAQDVADQLQEAIEDRGEASLVVSGGSTPRPFFEALREMELPWRQVQITLADERWVEPDDGASNEGFVRRHLLQSHAQGATFVPLKTAAATPEAGQEECEARLRAMPRPFDVVVLGMGGDGHTASLFPGAKELAAGLDPASAAGADSADRDPGRLCLAVHPPAAPHARMSMTLPALLASRYLALHITGEDKRQVLEMAREAGPEEELPIHVLLRRAAAEDRFVDVYWAP